MQNQTTQETFPVVLRFNSYYPEAAIHPKENCPPLSESIVLINATSDEIRKKIEASLRPIAANLVPLFQQKFILLGLIRVLSDSGITMALTIADHLKTLDNVQKEIDEKIALLKSSATEIQSVFLSEARADQPKTTAYKLS